MGSLDEHFAGLMADGEFARAMALDALRSKALVDERPAADAPAITSRLLPLVGNEATPELARVVEFLADLASHDALAGLLVTHGPSLAALLDSPLPAVRLAALPLLAHVPQVLASTGPALQRVALEDEDQRVRLGALLALAALHAEVAPLATSLYKHEADDLDRFIATLALLLAGHPVTRDMLDFALTSLRVRKLLLRCGDVPLVDNPRARLAQAMARHPDVELRELALKRELEHLHDEAWLDDATAGAMLELGRACGGESNLRAIHLVASRVFGPNGSLDLIEVLERFDLPIDPVVLQKQLGPAFPIGLPPQQARPVRKPWWRFWQR